MRRGCCAGSALHADRRALARHRHRREHDDLHGRQRRVLPSPAGVVDPGRLVDIGTRTPGGGFGNSSYPTISICAQRTTTLDGVYALLLFPRAMSLGTGGTAGTSGSLARWSPATTSRCSASFRRREAFSTSTKPTSTRTAVVLSHRFWTRRFNQDPSGRRPRGGGQRTSVHHRRGRRRGIPGHRHSRGRRVGAGAGSRRRRRRSRIARRIGCSPAAV